MKEKVMCLPAPLQKQILLRLCGCGIGTAMFLLAMIYGGDWRFLLPCAVLAVASLGAAASLADRCLQNKYVVIDAACTEIERVPLRRRIKALYLRTEQFSIKLVGVSRIRNLQIGDRITIYVADNTAVYEMDGNKVICSCIAIEKNFHKTND